VEIKIETPKGTIIFTRELRQGQEAVESHLYYGRLQDGHYLLRCQVQLPESNEAVVVIERTNFTKEEKKACGSVI